MDVKKDSLCASKGDAKKESVKGVVLATTCRLGPPFSTERLKLAGSLLTPRRLDVMVK